MKYFCAHLIIIATFYSCEQKSIDTTSHYEVGISFDSKNLSITGTMLVKWKNPSKKEIREVPFLFKTDSTQFLTGDVLVNGEVSSLNFVAKENTGFDGFYVQLNEDNVIGPNKEIILELKFKIIRNRYFNDKLFYQNLPLIPGFEGDNFNHFLQVHSNYNVNITLPSEYEIATTGNVIYQERMADQTTIIKTVAASVPSYGLVIFQDALMSEVTTKDGILIRSFYFEDDKIWGKRIAKYAKNIIEFYTDSLGFYPQPVITIIPGMAHQPAGGWPVSPNIVGIHRGLDKLKEEAETFAQWITAHEIGHQYWGYNYVLEPLEYPQWFGIGMGIYTDRLYAKSKNLEIDYEKRFTSRYVNAIDSGYNTTIMQTIETLDTLGYDWNSDLTHGKAYTVLRLLALEIGEDTFFEVFKYFLNHAKGINVTPEMFQSVCERISGQELDSFFKQWFYTNDYLDYHISNVKVFKKDNGLNLQLKIDRLGAAKISNLEVELVFDNGKSRVITTNGNDTSQEFLLNIEANVSKIRIDPKKRLPLKTRIEWTN